jgi:L,D-transpeptidase YbiS
MRGFILFILMLSPQLACAEKHFFPEKVRIIVVVEENLLYLEENGKIVKVCPVATGKNTILFDPKTGRRWHFATPKGVFIVVKKVKDPVWIKPDWAFIEEGKNPPSSFSERVKRGPLGKFALYLDRRGYMIHGTDKQWTIGKRVTHGCVRVGRRDMEFLFQRVKVGTPVYIY